MDNHNTAYKAVTSCSLGCAPALLFVAFILKCLSTARVKEMAFFEGEAKDSEQVHIGAINCGSPFTHQRVDFNTLV